MDLFLQINLKLPLYRRIENATRGTCVKAFENVTVPAEFPVPVTLLFLITSGPDRKKGLVKSSTLDEADILSNINCITMTKNIEYVISLIAILYLLMIKIMQ